MSETGGRLSPLRVGLVVLLIAGLAGGWIYYWFFKGMNFRVDFADKGKLEVAAPVYLSGVVIGRVAEIRPRDSGVSVVIRVRREHCPLITTASNFYIDQEDNQPALLMKNLGSGRALNEGEAVAGVDSFWAWNTLEYRHNLNQSGLWRKTVAAVAEMKDRVDGFLASLDWDRIGSESRGRLQEMADDLEKFFDDPDTQAKALELDRKLDDFKDALSRAGDSPEVEEMKKALEKLYERVRQELHKAAEPEVK